ncbi:MAG: HAMP domain-containing histidine kinase, partial [Bdellovibrionaceae bacterium]|nr:HAMP domain-containing histidine kinase [Pseudobdellovibrionaceae bacterium]
LNLQNNLPVFERPDTKDDLNNLKDYSEELNRYIQSILKLLRVESKEFKIYKETADLNGVIENVVDRLKPLATAKNIDLQLNLEPMFLIEFDVTLMTEVILNLIENAIKYTASNGVINIHTTETDFDVRVEVQDTGEGISHEDLEHIWKKFSRGKNQDLKTKGSGLGLYLAKYFIELHGGKISVKSELGKGTVFYIRLPIETN